MLGASPDLLVSCSCSSSSCPGGLGLCEIKCPDSIKDQLPAPSNWSHLVISNDGQAKLSEKSQYYTQIQDQMGVFKRNYCDFFVYTSHGHHLERIAFNSKFWERVKKFLVNFGFCSLLMSLCLAPLLHQKVLKK